MNRPTLEVADIIRQHGKDFIESNRSRLTWQQLKGEFSVGVRNSEKIALGCPVMPIANGLVG